MIAKVEMYPKHTTTFPIFIPIYPKNLDTLQWKTNYFEYCSYL